MSSGFDHDRVEPSLPPRRDSTATVLLAVAIAWGFLVILAALTVPVITLQAAPVTATATAPASPTTGASATPNDTGDGQKMYRSPRVSVLRHEGLAGVAIAGIPAAVSLLVASLLWVRARGRRTVLVPVAAWTLSIALVVAGVVGFVTFLVGIVAVPSGVLLVIACSQALRWPRTAPAMAART